MWADQATLICTITELLPLRIHISQAGSTFQSPTPLQVRALSHNAAEHKV